MKIMKLKINNISFFENDTFEFVFSPISNVHNDDIGFDVFEINSIAKSLNVIGIVGKNSSGKTTVLSILTSIIKLYLDNAVIPESLYKLFSEFKWLTFVNETASIETFWVKENDFIHIETLLNKNIDKVYIVEEKISIAKRKNIDSKIKMFDTCNYKPLIIRSQLKNAEYLSNDRSIISKQFQIMYGDLHYLVENNLLYVNFNFSPDEFELSPSIKNILLEVLDNSIEKLEFKDNNKIIIKFYGQNEFTIEKKELSIYLSSGTIKMLSLFKRCFDALKYGGYMILDEIENHLDKGLVLILIDLFRNPNINKHGATLIFTTHYAELLDSLHRNDSVYVVDKKNGKSFCTNYSKSHKRKSNDLKKSVRYTSGDLNIGPNQILINKLLNTVKGDI